MASFHDPLYYCSVASFLPLSEFTIPDGHCTYIENVNLFVEVPVVNKYGWY